MHTIKTPTITVLSYTESFLTLCKGLVQHHIFPLILKIKLQGEPFEKGTWRINEDIIEDRETEKKYNRRDQKIF